MSTSNSINEMNGINVQPSSVNSLNDDIAQDAYDKATFLDNCFSLYEAPVGFRDKYGADNLRR